VLFCISSPLFCNSVLLFKYSWFSTQLRSLIYETYKGNDLKWLFKDSSVLFCISSLVFENSRRLFCISSPLFCNSVLLFKYSWFSTQLRRLPKSHNHDFQTALTFFQMDFMNTPSLCFQFRHLFLHFSWGFYSEQS
jgi:hypothetical protein